MTRIDTPENIIDAPVGGEGMSASDARAERGIDGQVSCD